MNLKIPPVVVFFLSLVLMFGAYYVVPHWSYDFPYQVILSRVFLALGVLVAFFGIIAFRMNRTTTDPLHPEKATTLVTGGIYQYTRNPMYLGMAFVLVGGLIRIGNPASISGVLFLVWYLDRFQIRPEEKALTKAFGKPYKSYCEKVRRWV